MQKFQTALQQHAGLSNRMRFSQEQLAKVRDSISKRESCTRKDLCIYVAGSLGRLELGHISDLDVFLFADSPGSVGGQRTLSRLQEIQVLSEIIQVNAELKLPEFSGDGEHFKIHEVSQLLTGTGTATDDSENFFTTRLLLLLESKCLSNDALYADATKRIFEMYVRDGTGRAEYRPLFLLNDILRYWRTICLNYERTRHDPSKPWWKKNLNLKFSRKLTVFSTVLSMLVEQVDCIEKFQLIANRTPMQRLAYSLDVMGDDFLFVGFNKFLCAYEEFLSAKSDAKLERLNACQVERFNATSQQFDDFLHCIFSSARLDAKLVRYLLI